MSRSAVWHPFTQHATEPVPPVIARTEGIDAARAAMHYVSPVGEKDRYVSQAMSHVERYLPPAGGMLAA